MKTSIRVRSRVPMDRFLFLVALFCVVSYALLEHMSVPIPAFSSVKMPLVYLGGLCILLRFGPLLRAVKKKRYFYVIMTLLLFVVFLKLSVTFYDGPASMRDLAQRRTTRLILYLVELFFLMIWAAQSERSQYVLDFLFFYLLIVTLASDVLMFSGLISFGSQGEEYYLVGTKFTVAYYHINLLTFWFIRGKQRMYSDRKAKRIILVGVPFIVLVCIYVDCVTGAVGSVLLLLMFALLNTGVQKKILKLKSPMTLLLALGLSVLFPFLAEQIVSMPFVVTFIENVVGRETNLTGRLNIFIAFFEKMEKNWLWGYGYGNANSASQQLFGYANVQNALLQWVFQVGLPATVSLVLLMLVVFRRLSKTQTSAQSMPLVLLIYLYIVLGMIEITFSMSFLLWFALVFMLSNDAGALRAWMAQQEQGDTSSTG